MGLLQDGKWVDQWYDTKKSGGKFIRSTAQFRNWITADGSAGPSGDGGFKAQAGRYHLYISHACPWAHRTMIFRALKGLEYIITTSAVHCYILENSWTFDLGDDATGDTLYNAQYMYQIYTKADPQYSGRVTVPVLWDKQQRTIVSNESVKIIRMFNSAFDDAGAKAGNYYPPALRGEIDAVNEHINGVYKAGFATTQQAYEAALPPV